MTIKIEVTGASIPEVADKLLAIGRSLLPQPAVFEQEYKHTEITLPMDPVMPEVAAMEPADEVVEYVEVAETEQADPTPAPKSAPAAEATESRPTTQEPASTHAEAATEIDFHNDVVPVVLAVVKAKGKPAAEAILSQFGVDRASQVDPAQWQELIDAMKEAI